MRLLVPWHYPSRHAVSQPSGNTFETILHELISITQLDLIKWIFVNSILRLEIVEFI